MLRSKLVCQLDWRLGSSKGNLIDDHGSDWPLLASKETPSAHTIGQDGNDTLSRRPVSSCLGCSDLSEVDRDVPCSQKAQRSDASLKLGLLQKLAQASTCCPAERQSQAITSEKIYATYSLLSEQADSRAKEGSVATSRLLQP